MTTVKNTDEVVFHLCPPNGWGSEDTTVIKKKDDCSDFFEHFEEECYEVADNEYEVILTWNMLEEVDPAIGIFCPDKDNLVFIYAIEYPDKSLSFGK